jgi:predicted O-methyltransferase YrrM
MIDKKINRILKALQKRSNYEILHTSKIPHDKRMLAISDNTGIFYNILLKTMNAKRVLEIGTSTGYSTLWFADAVISNTRHNLKKGQIITIEKDQFKIKKAKKNFANAGISKIIEIKEGNAVDILRYVLNNFYMKKRNQLFDFVFIDADKDKYIEYFDLCLPLVRKGGIIAADNILLPKRFNRHMNKYLEHVRKCLAVESVTIPIDYGEEITIKISD